jgi:hypothetical protein
MLMHAKFMHELCSLLFHIPTYLDVMRCYNHVLHWFIGIFHRPPYFVYNSTQQEIPVLCIFTFQGPLMSHGTRWETPRGRYDEHNSKFSLSMKPKFNRSVGKRNHFWSLLLANFGRAHYRRQQQRGTCTQHNQTTLLQLTVRLSISLILLKTKD